MHRDEGVRATLSGCARSSSCSYIVNEQKKAEKLREEAQNTVQPRTGI